MLTTSAINAFVTPLVTMCVPPENFGWPVRRPPHRSAPLPEASMRLSLFSRGGTQPPRVPARHAIARRSPRARGRRLAALYHPPPHVHATLGRSRPPAVAPQLRILMDTSLITFVVITSFIVCNAIIIAKPNEWFLIICFQLLGAAPHASSGRSPPSPRPAVSFDADSATCTRPSVRGGGGRACACAHPRPRRAQPDHACPPPRRRQACSTCCGMRRSSAHRSSAS